MNHPSPFPTFATAVLNQLAASLWLSLLRTFPVSDVLGLMMLEQLAFSHWAAQELARKQSRDLAAGAESDSPAMLRLSRERRAECRLQAQLARQLNQHLRAQATPGHAKSSKIANTSPPADIKISAPANSAAPRSPKVGRNELCPCQSGRKYKHCCLNKPAALAGAAAAAVPATQ